MRADDLLKIVYVGDPQVSPDGRRILFSHKTINDKNKYITNLQSVDRDGKFVQWTQGDAGAGQGRWSPDGKNIAFISGREEKLAQIFLLPSGGGEGRKLSNLPEGTIGEMSWSPDSKLIAFTFREKMPGFTQKETIERTAKGLSTPPIEIDDLWYRLDGDGYFANQRHKIYILDVATGQHRLLYEAAVLGGYSFDWAPNGKELAIAHSASKKPLIDPPNDQIWRVSLDGQAVQIPNLPKGDKSSVKWSPDGNWIAYAGDVDEKDPWGTRNSKLYVVKIDGSDFKCLTDHTDYDLATGTLSDTKDAAHNAPLVWAKDSSSIYVQVGWHGETQVGRVSLDSSFDLLSEGRHHIGFGNLSRDGKTMAITFGNATQLSEVGFITLNPLHEEQDREILTDFNRAFHDEVKLSEPEEFWLDSTPNKDGTPSKVHGWVMKPIDYLSPRRYPAVLEIHGGPHAQYGWALFHEFQLLAAAGYVVVYTNPRGSKGYGENYCAEIRGDWGNKDWEDIEVVTRWMQHQSFVHPGQMAVMGGSYGGYMTNWAISHTDAYRCAITDRCVSNFTSMAGNSDFPFNKDGYFRGTPWGPPEEMKELWRQSPIAYFNLVKTPTLVIHSEGDLRCNIEQSEQVFAALQMQGIESRFVRYPVSTSHGMSRSGPPDMRLHRLGEITGWLSRYLKV